MKRVHPSLCLVAVLATTACQEAVSAPSTGVTSQFSSGSADYTLTDLGTFTGPNAMARGISNGGVVTGETFGPAMSSRAFVWSAREGFLDLGTLGGPGAAGLGINEPGHVVGVSLRGTGPVSAFLWTPKDGMIDLLPGVTERGDARAINSRGAITGTIGSPALVNHEARAYIWTRQDGLTLLGNLPGGTGAVARAINARDEIVGEATGGPGNTEIHGFLWSRKDGMRDIGFVGPLPSGTGPFAINNRGHVAGARITNPANGARGFLWTPDDGMVEIHPPGALRSFVNGMNERGDLVGGYVANLMPPIVHAFFWSERTGYVTLPELASANTVAFGINNSGEIAGRSEAPTGEVHAVIWTTR